MDLCMNDVVDGDLMPSKGTIGPTPDMATGALVAAPNDACVWPNPLEDLHSKSEIVSLELGAPRFLHNAYTVNGMIPLIHQPSRLRLS